MLDQSVLSSFAWPGAMLAVAVVFMWRFRDPITRFIDRTRSVSREGVRAYDDPQPSARRPDAPTEFFDEFESPLFLEVESDIDRDLHARGITDPTFARKFLLKTLARTFIFGQFESVESHIFASQFKALNFLNEQPAPIPMATIEVSFYAMARETFPEFYENLAFERWLFYLQNNSLVVETPTGISISGRGREFLKWCVENGRYGQRHF